MIWIHKRYANIQQISVQSPDICAIVLQTNSRDLFLASVYIPCSINNRILDDPRLGKKINLLYEAFRQEQLSKSHLEFILTGDFNCWDALWGGDEIASHSRHREGQLLVNLMADLDLQLLLPRGTITYTEATRLGHAASTIDLVFSSTRLAEDRILYTPLDTDHGSDHAAIQIVFTMTTPENPFPPSRRLFKSAPWNKISQSVTENIYLISAPSTNIDAYANQLFQTVQIAINAHVPLTKPSPYAKRWWCKDLTLLRKEYTCLKNRFHRAKRHNLSNSITATLDTQAWVAK